MPRVLFISYSAALGGAERVLVDWATAMPQDAVLACPDGPLLDQARAAGLSTLVLPGRGLELRAGVATRVGAVRALLGHASDVRRLVHVLEPDVLVAWGMRTGLARLLGAPGGTWVLAHHDFLPGPLIGAAVRAAASRAALVVTPSRAVADELAPGGRLVRRLEVVAPGVDVDRFSREDTVPAQPPEVIVLGTLAAWKRPDLALEAVAVARQRIPELRLRLVGAPLDDAGERLLGSLRRRAQQPDLVGAVAFEGQVADPQDALSRATCLLHSAPREPFGLAVLEALASERPAVVPDACGPAEIVDAGSGVRYPPGNATAAAMALVEIVGNPERAAEMGRRGRRRARERFDAGAARARFGALLAATAPRRTGTTRAPGASLSLVTVTHNSAPELAALLSSVQRHLPGVRVIVVDCASRDESLEVARRRSGVTAIGLDENVGFGGGCNRGLAQVSTPATALVNPDVELLDDSLLTLAAEALRADRPPRLLAPRVLNADGSLQDTVHPAPGGVADLVRSLVPPAAVPGRAGVALAPWRSSAPRRVGWAVGCAIVAPTATLAQLGPFDESLFLYGEDLELGLHARARGIATWLWPSARVIHHRAHSSAAAFGGEPLERLARARHDVVARRLGPRHAALDDALQALTFASRVAVKPLVGRSAARERAQLRALAAARQAA